MSVGAQFNPIFPLEMYKQREYWDMLIVGTLFNPKHSFRNLQRMRVLAHTVNHFITVCS